MVFLASCTQKKGSQINISDTGKIIEKDTIALIDTATSDSTLITCSGIGKIRLTDNMSGLIRKAGEENITADSLFLEGSFEGIVTKLWQDTPKEITVRWTEREEPYRLIRFLQIKEGTIYRFANGIRVGTNLQEMEQLNAGPLSFYGFGWDYGGTFIGFNDGKLQNEIPCFNGVFSIPIEGSIEVHPEIVGDKTIRSDNPALEGFDIKLSVIRINRKKR